MLLGRLDLKAAEFSWLWAFSGRQRRATVITGKEYKYFTHDILKNENAHKLVFYPTIDKISY